MGLCASKAAVEPMPPSPDTKLKDTTTSEAVEVRPSPPPIRPRPPANGAPGEPAVVNQPVGATTSPPGGGAEASVAGGGDTADVESEARAEALAPKPATAAAAPADETTEQPATATAQPAAAPEEPTTATTEPATEPAPEEATEEAAMEEPPFPQPTPTPTPAPPEAVMPPTTPMPPIHLGRKVGKSYFMLSAQERDGAFTFRAYNAGTSTSYFTLVESVEDLRRLVDDASLTTDAAMCTHLLKRLTLQRGRVVLHEAHVDPITAPPAVQHHVARSLHGTRYLLSAVQPKPSDGFTLTAFNTAKSTRASLAVPKEDLLPAESTGDSLAAVALLRRVDIVDGGVVLRPPPSFTPAPHARARRGAPGVTHYFTASVVDARACVRVSVFTLPAQSAVERLFAYGDLERRLAATAASTLASNLYEEVPAQLLAFLCEHARLGADGRVELEL